jgi:putative endonuclease
MKNIWWVYIVQCKDKTLYTGCTNNLEQRIQKHNLGKGAKYTKARRPVRLKYSEKVKTHSLALIREIEIKKLTRQKKEELIAVQKRART